LDCFGLPREIWEYEWAKIVAAIGRFGPYLKYKDLFVSIPKWWEEPLDPYTITLEQSIPLIQQKIEKENNKYIHEFTHEWKKIEVLNGMYWPYIKYEKKNYKIPKWW
jgi:DNA topoisomerase-1